MSEYDDAKRAIEIAEKLRKSNIVHRLKNKLIPLKDKLADMFSSVSFIWYYFFGPIFNFFYWIFFTVFFSKIFMSAWDKFAYTEKEGKKEFSRARGAGVIASFAAIAFFMYSIVGFIWDATLYLTTARVNEVVYLSNAQEIIPEDNIFSVQGCAIPDGQVGIENFSCSTDESLYFRIHPNLFAQLWSYTSTGSFFYPDYVAATIAPGWSRCTITSYGFRLKTLIRSFEIYPEMLSARCETIND